MGTHSCRIINRYTLGRVAVTCAVVWQSGACVGHAEETPAPPSEPAPAAAAQAPNTAPAATPVPAPADTAASAATVSAAAAPAPAAPSGAAIQDGMVVKLDYQLHTDGGEMVDTTDGRGPFEYTHGRGQIIPGLERQLAGLHVGDSKDVTVRPEDAYGPVNPEATEEIDRAQLPQDAQPQVGMVLRGTDPEGNVYRALIKEVKEKTVVLDLNHPLAGKTLTFHVKVVDVHPETATP